MNEKTIKKIFIIVLAVLYIGSGIGYTSVQHNCRHVQKVLTTVECECCSEGSVEHHQQDTPSENACCSGEYTNVPTKEIETTPPGDCCEVQYKHNHLDSSSLLLSIDVDQAADQSSGESYFYPKNPQNIDSFELTTFVNPFRHLNLPLLI